MGVPHQWLLQPAGTGGLDPAVVISEEGNVKRQWEPFGIIIIIIIIKHHPTVHHMDLGLGVPRAGVQDTGECLLLVLIISTDRSDTKTW